MDTTDSADRAAIERVSKGCKCGRPVTILDSSSSPWRMRRVYLCSGCGSATRNCWCKAEKEES